MENLPEEQKQNLDEASAPSETTEKKPSKSKDRLVCKSTLRIAHDNEEVVFENSDIKATINIKNPKLHGQFRKGETYSKLF